MSNAVEGSIDEIKGVVTTRPSTASDTEFARKTHHASYHDVIVRQFGSFDEKMQDKFFLKEWNPENYEIILYDGVQAGYLSIERSALHIVAHDLVILPEFQGKGIGSGLLKEIILEANVKNIPVRLVVLKANIAQNLYRRLGFKEIGMSETHLEMEYVPNEK